MEVFMPVIESNFSFFQRQEKRVLGHALEALQVGFGKAPKGFDAVAVGGPLNELVLAVMDAKMAANVPRRPSHQRRASRRYGPSPPRRLCPG